MSTTIYVLDTSYLIELFGCGQFGNPEASKRVRDLFKEANAHGGRFFVPLPCLFELGNHIANVKHDKERADLAARLVKDVGDCLRDRRPWMITPTGPPEAILPDLLNTFSGLASKQQIGLVDTFTVSEARRLKQEHQRFKAQVHIWTNDRALKGREPDAESEPYFWSKK